MCHQKIFCCINPRKEEGFVTISIEDAKKIREKTGKKFQDFLDYSKLSKKALQSCEDDKENSEIIKEGRVLRLKMGKDGRCVFLKNNQCSVYEIRPLLCRMYPFWYRKTKSGKIEIELFDRNEPCRMSKANTSKLKIPRKEMAILKKIARKMEKETKHYKKNIDRFVRQNKLI
jgi:Fe-S-cluster containining protein